MPASRPTSLRALAWTGLALLTGCLFETKVPRTVPLQLDGTFARFDPLVVTFQGRGGGAPDTLYRGPGGTSGDGIRELNVEGLGDTGQVRLDGYIAGRLAYRLDLPWPEDTLIALPRWTPVGAPLDSRSLQTASLAFREGRPLIHSPRYQGDLAAFDGKEWRWTDLRADWSGEGGYHIDHDIDELFVDEQGTWLFRSSDPVMVRRVADGDWSLAMRDTGFHQTQLGGLDAIGFSEGVLAVAAGAFTDEFSYVRVRQYDRDSGWGLVDKTFFRRYALPGGWPRYSSPMARRNGRTAVILNAADGHPAAKIFQYSGGSWDSTPEFPRVLTPSLELDGEDVYLAFQEAAEDSAPWQGAITLRRFSNRKWEDVGHRDIFGQPGHSPAVRIHAGTPYVGAHTEKGFLMARLAGNRWEILVDPRFLEFGVVLDFALDPAGIPHLVVHDGRVGTRVVKYLDPHRP